MGKFVADPFSNILAISQKYKNKINKICQPVTEHLGVDYITYHTVHLNGKCTMAVNRPDIDEYYVENNIYANDPFLRHPQFLQSGIMLWNETFEPEFYEQINQAGAMFNLDLGFSMIERSADKVTILGFAAKKQYPHQLSHYLNELPLFKRFFQYFLNEAHPIISKMDNEPIELVPLMKEKFYESPLNTHLEIPNNLRHKFMLEISGKYWEPHFLTKREKDCLKALLRGHTAKMAALELNLSYRTVEHLIERLRHKLNCLRKSDLFVKAKELEEIGAL